MSNTFDKRVSFLEAFGKFRKANISFLMSVSPSVLSHKTTRLIKQIFMEFVTGVFLEKICREIQI